MNKRGFTLVEIIAAIVVLGIIMIVAIPTVSSQIANSRRKAFYANLNRYVEGAREVVEQSKSIKAVSRDVTYYIPKECISIDNGEESGYGTWEELYVAVTYDGLKHKYYITAYDNTSHGMELTQSDKINDTEIVTKSELDNKVGIGSRGQIKIIDKDKCSTTNIDNGDDNDTPYDPGVTIEAGVYVVTLNNQGATTPGVPAIYEKYNTGWYSDPETSTKITKVSVPARTGYTFEGYFEKRNSSGTKAIDATGNILVNSKRYKANTIIYAGWTQNTFTVTLDNMGATTPGTSTIYEKFGDDWYKEMSATTTISSITIPTKTGYTFGGYYTNSDGSGTKIIGSDGAIVAESDTIIEDSTIYAKWIGNNYDIQYHLDGGSHGTKHPSIGTYDYELTIDNPTKTITASFVKEDDDIEVSSMEDISAPYVFAGWNISGMDSIEHIYGSNRTTNESIDGTLETKYKNLRSTPGTVRFDAIWSPPTITLPSVVKPDYYCTWSSIVSGTEVEWESNDEYTPLVVNGATTRTFTAKCIPNAEISCENVKYDGTVQTIATCENGTISGEQQTNVGTYEVTCTGNEGYGDSTETCSIGIGEPTITCLNKMYSGSVQTIATCENGTISNHQQTNIGTYTVRCTGTGNYASTVTKDCMVTEPGKPTITCKNVTFNGKTQEIASCENGTISNHKKKNAGTYAVSCTGTGIYSGTATENCTIKPKSPKLTCVTRTFNNKVQTIAKCDNGTLSNHKQKNAGTYDVECTGTGNYATTAEKQCTINPKPPTLECTNKEYNGKTQTIAKCTNGTISNHRHANKGTYTVTCVGTGNYEGTVTKKCKITCSDDSWHSGCNNGGGCASGWDTCGWANDGGCPIEKPGTTGRCHCYRKKTCPKVE